MGLSLILSICDKCYGSVIKSTLLCQRHTTCHNHCRGVIPQKEKQRKPLSQCIAGSTTCAALFFLFFLGDLQLVQQTINTPSADGDKEVNTSSIAFLSIVFVQR